ncbi:oxygen-independent coproporphyrinogen III oxidase [Maribacter polysaccharolyticus]|uniref:oxygen-independent coproporphyrinogen III oxidase n=1 Tax=Maribacter polysaccharolyticus TaxID=3020831 RepID=UPI00237F555E|nr:oxygen-independent coproporphyrinogen III oxidase [Maribacter polysaccharolyticus]MDE3742575.1 oxygen-independent coproporphyrinogen III oxidase [Maribacter polysaccharolyticus]
MSNLIQKYNIPGPRYTSYPTVPYWNQDSFTIGEWKRTLKQSFGESNEKEGISLYIHLPYCESLCTFCGCHKHITKRHEVEAPYITTVLKEWKLYCDLLGARPKIKELHLGGGTPTFFSPDNLKRLINGIFQLADKTQEYGFSFEGHPNNTTKEHLQALYDVGFRRVSYGVQDYNEKVQKAIHRIQPFENVRRATEAAREIGYTSVGHDLIFGLPHQTLEHVKETILKTKSLRPDRLAFYSYAHVPWIKGSGQRGFKDEDLPSPNAKREQYEEGKKLLTKVGYKEIGMDHFALEGDSLYLSMVSGRLHRNFMGYTASKTQVMIGLGASSISDSWYSFAQNVKNLVEYERLVNENTIPIYRGHILTVEDRVIRKHILNLMCRFKTSWDTKESYFPEISLAKEKLAEMEQDGLVEFGIDELRVTEKGQPFIRNICMAFDVLLHRKEPETRLFSMTI